MPVFPLKIVLYPGEEIRLYIFEERYKQMINECLEEKKPFGIATYLNDRIMEYGTEAEIIKIDKKPAEGELHIKTKGVRLLRILDYQDQAQNKLYPAAVVQVLEKESARGSNPMLRNKVQSRVNELMELLNLPNKKIESARDLYSFSLAHNLGLNLKQEYDLLTIRNENSRLFRLLEHLEYLIPKAMEDALMNRKIKMNGHFKNPDDT